MNPKQFSKFHRRDIIRPMAQEIVSGQALMLIIFFLGWELWQGDIFLSGVIFVVFAATCNWLISLFIGQKLTGLLNSIQGAINEVKKGNFSFRIPSLSSTDKTNILINEINLMLDSIASREDALMNSEDYLREMNIKLENLVEERARQLNQSLRIAQEKERELRKAQSIGSIGSWTYDFATEAISWSEETFQIFGLPIGSEVSVQKVIEFIHPDDRELANSNFQNGLSGKPYDFEYRILVSGQEKWIRGKIELEYDSDEKPIKALGIVQDITAWKQAVIKLKESETRLDLAIRSAELGVWSWDINQQCGHFDEFVSELYGFDPPVLTATDDEFYRMVHPDDLEPFKTALHVSLEDNKPFISEYRIVRPDGSIRHLTARGALERDKNGKPHRFTGILCDITDKKVNEEMLQYLASVLDSSADAIISMSLDNSIRSWNKGAQNLLGYAPEEIVGQPASILIPSNLIDFENEQFLKIATEASEGKYESQRLRKNGNRVEVSISLAPIRDSNGKVFAISNVARDISERKTEISCITCR